LTGGIVFDAGGDQLSAQLLAQLTTRGNPRTYQRGEVLFEEGSRSDSLFILLSGELKVFTRGDHGRELVYNVMRSGEFFGELSLDGGPRSASVKAVTTSICVVVGREQFRDFLTTYPEFAESLVLKLIARVRHATEQLRSVALKDVYGRVVTLLNELAVERNGLRSLDRSVTQQEIADLVGASREMVNQIFRDLVRGGYIEKDKERHMLIARELPRNW
jgi:CRP/FNR family cyclic AMP-dependent transcriptional regulator